VSESDNGNAAHADMQSEIADLRAQHTADLILIAELEADGIVDRNKITNLELALATSRRVGAAIGILMGRLGLTEDQAFERLRAELERSDRKLRDVAEDVIFTGDIN
jgi:hypothetical protein